MQSYGNRAIARKELTMPDKGCNGWSNYPTWTVIMVIGNTESLYNYFKRITRDVVSSTQDETDRISILAEVLEETVNSLRPQRTNHIWEQLMTYAVGKVNYREIALSMIGDCLSDDF